LEYKYAFPVSLESHMRLGARAGMSQVGRPVSAGPRGKVKEGRAGIDVDLSMAGMAEVVS